MGMGIALGILLLLILSFPFVWIAGWVLGDLFGGGAAGCDDAARGPGHAAWR